jgi:hypothetical protein
MEPGESPPVASTLYLSTLRCIPFLLLNYYIIFCCLFVSRREDVSKAVSKMDRKHLEHAVTAIRKRLDKHFHASADVAVST